MFFNIIMTQTLKLDFTDFNILLTVHLNIFIY